VLCALIAVVETHLNVVQVVSVEDVDGDAVGTFWTPNWLLLTLLPISRATNDQFVSAQSITCETHSVSHCQSAPPLTEDGEGGKGSSGAELELLVDVAHQPLRFTIQHVDGIDEATHFV